MGGRRKGWPYRRLLPPTDTLVANNFSHLKVKNKHSKESIPNSHNFFFLIVLVSKNFTSKVDQSAATLYIRDTVSSACWDEKADEALPVF